MRRKQWGTVSLPEISLTPLIDTALVLLVIFMVTVPVMHQGIAVDLPKGHVDESDAAPQALVVSVDHTGRMFINAQETNASGLAEDLAEHLYQNACRTIFVHADERIQYGTLFSLIDHVKDLEGVDNVILSSISQAR